MTNYRHILLTTDFSMGSGHVSEQGVTLAKLMGAKLSLLHVVEPLPVYGYGFVGAAESEIQAVEEGRRKLAEEARIYNIPKNNQYLEVGSAKVEINRVAEKLGVDLIILGSHGRRGLDYLLGSTANAVIHAAKCDVLTVRFQPVKE